MDNNKKYVRAKIPQEASEWMERKRKNMEKLAREIGYKKRFPLTKTLSIISKLDSEIIVTKENIRDAIKKNHKK